MANVTLFEETCSLADGAACHWVNDAFIALAKRDPAYRAWRRHISGAKPSDTWYTGDAAFVAFALLPEAHTPPAQLVFEFEASTRELRATRTEATN